MKIDVKISKREELKIQKEKDTEWAKQIKIMGGYECAICGNTFGLNSHHLIPREIKEFRHDLKNGLCLCINHHKFSRKISAHNNPFNFILWLAKYKPEMYYETYRKSVLLAKDEVIL